MVLVVLVAILLPVAVRLLRAALMVLGDLVVHLLLCPVVRAARRRVRQVIRPPMAWAVPVVLPEVFMGPNR